VGAREDTMQYHGVFTCPSWCVQPTDEDQWEQHVSDWRVCSLDDGDGAMVRIWSSWWSDSDDNQVEIALVPASGTTVRLSDWARDQLNDLIDHARDDMDSYDEQWAYPGAEDDANAADSDDDEEEEADGFLQELEDED
jgi:hypothetical protein